jgi:RND family efflux transporter MFP subunit
MNRSASQAGRTQAGHGRRAGWVLLILFTLAAVACMVIVQILRKPPQNAVAEVPIPLVAVERLAAREVRAVVRGQGTVRPAVQVEIAPEVSGRVVFVHSQLRAGGVIGAGERILQVDPMSYELAARQARAAVDEAQTRLEVEQTQAQLQQRDRRPGNSEGTETQNLMALQMESRVRHAGSSLEAARAGLALAELQLGRTSVQMPFDLFVADETADLGQYASAGRPLARAYGTETFEIEVPIRSEELAWLDVLGNLRSWERDAVERAGPPVEVKATIAGREHVWDGSVAGTTGRVDPSSGKVFVLVEVARPLEASADRPPLLPGTPVEVAIPGRNLENAVAVPRRALHGDNQVWLVRDNRITAQDLDIVRADEEFVYVASASLADAEVVVDAPVGAAPGQEVRIAEAGAK